MITDILKKFVYPVSVVIFEERNNNILLRRDKARRVSSDNQIYYQFKNMSKVKLPPQSYGNMFIDSKGRNFIFVYSPKKNVYVPMSLSEVKKETEKMRADFKMGTEDMEFWYAMTVKEALTKFGKKSFFEKYYPVMLIMAVCLGAGLMIYFSWQGYAENVNSVALSNPELAHQIGRLTDVLDKVLGSTASGVPQVVKPPY